MIENCNPISKRHSFRLIMGDIDDCRARTLVERRKLIFHRGTQMHVEIGERFIKQYQRRCCHQTTRKRHPLSLTAGQISRATITEPLQIDQRQRLPHTAFPLGFSHLGHPQTIADIFSHRHMRPKRIILEHNADLTLLWWHTAVNMRNTRIANMDFAAINLFKAGNHPQKRGLAAAGRSEDSNEFTILHIQRNLRQGLKSVESLGNLINFQSRHGSTPFGRRRANRFVASISMNVTATARMDMAAA